MSSPNAAAVLGLIDRMQPQKPYILAIDGRCASGKTTLANELSQSLSCNVVHMDDFYLPFALRTPERMAQPGGTIEFERLISEIIAPLLAGRKAVYRPYACHENRFLPSVTLSAAKSTIVEGSYSCHPCLADMLGIKVFMDIAPDKQLSRIALRDPGHVEAFRTMWIPREEFYFAECAVRERCDMVLMN